MCLRLDVALHGLWHRALGSWGASTPVAEASGEGSLGEAPAGDALLGAGAGRR